jgi:hypothetical protein
MMLEADDICSVLAPIAITSAMITASSLTVEDPNPAWSSTPTYTAAQRTYLASTHRVYEATGMVGNTNKDPSLPANQFDAAGAATFWIDAEPTNKYAMFDTVVSTPTVGTSPLTMTLRPGYLNGFALFGIDGDTLAVTVKDAPGGTVIYSHSGPLEGSAPADYYEYFFDRFKPQTQFIASGIDPYNGCEVTLTVTKASGPAKVGMFALGDMRPLGVPLRGASVEPVDYSYVSTDAFGTTAVKKRNNATGLVISAKMAIEDANTVLDTVKELLGIPVVVVGSTVTMYEALTVFGLMSARQQYDEFGEPVLNITVKGTI